MARETNGRMMRAGLALVGAAVLGAAAPAMAQDSTAAKVDPQITAEAIKRATGPNILIKGKGFTPGGAIRVVGSPPPGSSTALNFGTIKADSTGAFTLRKEEACTTDDVNQLSRRVEFTVTDEASKKAIKARVEGGPWGC
jgi:hypothetical protein